LIILARIGTVRIKKGLYEPFGAFESQILMGRSIDLYVSPFQRAINY